MTGRRSPNRAGSLLARYWEKIEYGVGVKLALFLEFRLKVSRVKQIQSYSDGSK